MSDDTGRRRAPAMTPDERRAMIVRAALPLLAEFGAAVTTAQIARAAGIGEATIFRVFDDKEALLRACIQEALDPENMLSELRSIPLTDPLPDRLVEAAEALDAHLTRMGTVIGAVHASGMPHQRLSRDLSSAPTRKWIADRYASRAATRAAIIDLLEPDRESLRVPVETAADVFLHTQFGRQPVEEKPDRKALVDVLLHGALRHDAAAV
jgi:AcrR family transcriptional regulator